MELERFSYDNKIVKNFAIATIFWGVSRNAGRCYLSQSQLFWPASKF